MTFHLDMKAKYTQDQFGSIFPKYIAIKNKIQILIERRKIIAASSEKIQDMMNTALFLTIVCLHLYRTSATYGVRLLVNDGYELPAVPECTNLDSIQHETEYMYEQLARRRNLRRVPTYPSFCRNVCRGIAKGYCQGLHPQCNGYRRLEQAVTAPGASPESVVATAPALAPVRKIAKKRTLPESVFKSGTATCEEDVAFLNNGLDGLKDSFGAGSACGKLLSAPRTYECLTTIDNCRVQKIELLNANTDTVVNSNFATGMSFCGKAFPIAFRAVKDPCVCNVLFTLKDSTGAVISSHEAIRHPYVSFDHSQRDANGVVNVYGKSLTEGSYKLEYYPDSDQSLQKDITFSVHNKC